LNRIRFEPLQGVLKIITSPSAFWKNRRTGRRRFAFLAKRNDAREEYRKKALAASRIFSFFAKTPREDNFF
jgi:hypothetical protein